jgi:hypothetical protein
VRWEQGRPTLDVDLVKVRAIIDLAEKVLDQMSPY